MDADWRTTGILMVVGLVPFALLGGLGPAGDHSIVPWAAGFGAQAAVVLGVRAWRRWRGSRALRVVG